MAKKLRIPFGFPSDPTPSQVRTLRNRLASGRPYEQQDALRAVLAFAARTKLIAFSTAVRIEEIGWPPPEGDLQAALRLAVAGLIACLVWEAVWPPDDEVTGAEAGGDAEGPAPSAPGG